MASNRLSGLNKYCPPPKIMCFISSFLMIGMVSLLQVINLFVMLPEDANALSFFVLKERVSMIFSWLNFPLSLMSSSILYSQMAVLVCLVTAGALLFLFAMLAMKLTKPASLQTKISRQF